MLKLENITVAYHENIVLEGINFQLEDSEFLGIIGPNGSGKTTLLRVITGVKHPVSGKVMLDGENITSMSRKKIAQIMAVVPQSSFIPVLLTVEDVVMMGRYPHQKKRFTITDEDIKVVEKAMEKTDIIGIRNRLVSELSGGERQQLIIARALAQEPKILLLDEPTANLDVKHQMKILNLVKSLVREGKITAIMVIHDLNLSIRFCDRVILLYNHKIYSQGEPKNVITQKNLKTVYEVETELKYNEKINSQQVIIINEIS